MTPREYGPGVREEALLLLALPEGFYLVAISACSHAAPAAAVGLCPVVEPEHAAFILAFADEVEVPVSDQVATSLCDGRKHLPGRLVLADALDAGRLAALPHQAGIAAGLHQ